MEHGGDESLASMVDVHGCCGHQRLAQPQLGEFQARGRWGRDSFTALGARPSVSHTSCGRRDGMRMPFVTHVKFWPSWCSAVQGGDAPRGDERRPSPVTVRLASLAHGATLSRGASLAGEGLRTREMRTGAESPGTHPVVQPTAIPAAPRRLAQRAARAPTPQVRRRAAPESSSASPPRPIRGSGTSRRVRPSARLQSAHRSRAPPAG